MCENSFTQNYKKIFEILAFVHLYCNVYMENNTFYWKWTIMGLRDKIFRKQLWGGDFKLFLFS